MVDGLGVANNTRPRYKLLFPFDVSVPRCSADDDADVAEKADIEVELDEVDRPPTNLRFSRWDQLFTLAGAGACLFDWASDLLVARWHLTAGRMTTGYLILAFALVPSLLLNALSATWCWEARKRYSRVGLLLRLLACVCQLGATLWHVETLRFGRQLTRAVAQQRATGADSAKIASLEKGRARLAYVELLQADRDAAILRLFEAFLESAPQLLIQAHFVASMVQRYASMPHGGIFVEGWRFYWLQLWSIGFSLVSLAWALAAQHRSLRFARQDKENVRPASVCVLFLWRACTLAARLIAVTLLGLVAPVWAVCVACALHLLLTSVHLARCQGSVDFGGSCRAVDLLVLAMAACVHLFTPLNVVEGRTRWRYLAAYTLEFFENLAIFALVHQLAHFSCWHLALIANVSLFAAGIFCMLTYYSCLHPALPLCMGWFTRSTSEDDPMSKMQAVDDVAVGSSHGCSAQLQSLSEDKL